MKLFRQEQEQLIFEFSGREKSLLLAILNLFPLVPLAHHQLSRDATLPDAELNQQLLEASLKSQKTDQQKWLATLLAKPDCLKPVKSNFHFTVTRSDLEGLLQVLNDVRVGSWLALGSPNLAQEKKLILDAATAVQVHRMELAGLFQMFFLNAINEVE